MGILFLYKIISKNLYLSNIVKETQNIVRKKQKNNLYLLVQRI